MRVLDLNTLYIDGGEGGVNTYLREKSRCLQEIDRGTNGSSEGRISHTIVVPGLQNRKTTLGNSRFYTIKSPRVPGNAQHRLLINFPRIAAILREERPDLVEVDCSYFLAHVAARALRHRKVPIVGFYHVHLPMLYTRPVRNLLRRGFRRQTEPLSWLYARYCARPCARVVVATEDLYQRLEGKSFPPLDVVPLGVNLDLFRPRTNGARPAVSGIDPARPVVLFVGRLSKEKDLDMLYAAHRELEKDGGTQLLIAGDGPLGREARRFARNREGIVYLGTCAHGEKLAELYRSADVLAVPSRNETFSLIVLEAFASGLPVVAVKQGGPAEICAPGIGALATPGDAQDFAAKLRGVLRGKIRATECREYVENSYSWDRTFRRLLAVYDSTLDGTLARESVLG
jgi:alpha-1,6-mannosyltransferase